MEGYVFMWNLVGSDVFVFDLVFEGWWFKLLYLINLVVYVLFMLMIVDVVLDEMFLFEF